MFTCSPKIRLAEYHDQIDNPSLAAARETVKRIIVETEGGRIVAAMNRTSTMPVSVFDPEVIEDVRDGYSCLECRNVIHF